jgi:hypothetical protein
MLTNPLYGLQHSLRSYRGKPYHNATEHSELRRENGRSVLQAGKMHTHNSTHYCTSGDYHVLSFIPWHVAVTSHSLFVDIYKLELFSLFVVCGRCYTRISYFMIKNGVFWDVTPCGSCKNWRFGVTYSSIIRVEGIVLLKLQFLQEPDVVTSKTTAFFNIFL